MKAIVFDLDNTLFKRITANRIYVVELEGKLFQN